MKSFSILHIGALASIITALKVDRPWACKDCAFRCPITVEGFTADTVIFKDDDLVDLLDKIYADPICHEHDRCFNAGSRQTGWIMEGIKFFATANVVDDETPGKKAVIDINTLTIAVPPGNVKTGKPKHYLHRDFDCVRA